MQKMPPLLLGLTPSQFAARAKPIFGAPLQGRGPSLTGQRANDHVRRFKPRDLAPPIDVCGRAIQALLFFVRLRSVEIG
jgi:hypothetical protein